MANARSKQAKGRAGAAQRPRPRATPARTEREERRSHHGRELAAIACVAIAAFLVFTLYFGWEGGRLGGWLAEGLRFAVGVAAYVVPLLLCYVAYLLVSGGDRPARRGVSAGIACLSVALLVAAAADSFGLFAGERPDELFVAAYMAEHGGLAGEVVYAPLQALIGRLGVNVLVIALAFAGLLLVTGSSLGLWARRSRAGVSAAGRAARERAAAFEERRREAATRLLEHGEEATVALGAGDTRVTSYGPAASAHDTRLIDGAQAAPEIFSEPASGYAAATAAPALRVEEVDDGEQLALDAADGEDRGAAHDGDAGADAESGPFAAEAPRRTWRLPDPEILRHLGEGTGEPPATIAEVSRRLIETLGHFGIAASLLGTVSGPRVTRYELQLAPGIKVSRVAGLKDDLAYSLAATEIRVLAPIPGKTAVGVEVPNTQANYVALGDIHGPFPQGASPLAFWLGKEITGRAVLADLVQMVHLLIAGTTGSGKSGCINALISSILLRATPDDVRMIMIDPKKVELSNFDGIPHLLAPVVTNMKQANYVLENICREMDHRYEVMSREGSAQNLRELNKKRERRGDEPLPYIMVVIDELADLMMVAPAEVEDTITRLGQLGRGAGIHLVVATQRPSVDVVTGMIKSNIPSRIAFAVSSQTDSRVILDQGGAESLLGNGDMLFHPLGHSRLLRVQGAFMTAAELKLITEHWKQQAKPEFQEDLLENPALQDTEAPQGGGGDELLAEAIRTVVSTGAASVALLQRRLRVGYARAGRLVDIMEQMGIISGYDGSKARGVLITEDDLPATLAALDGGDATVPAAEAVSEEALVAEE
ncbi:MAG: DNA translocase FtsK 4TM domain-containing protein [Thermoleophilia bacterium]|nr:DNA translocase FtsK 4TM domain-containing protein [Thermoleophilia bacterium]